MVGQFDSQLQREMLTNIGLDIDWEYPTSMDCPLITWGGSAVNFAEGNIDDMEASDFVALLRETRAVSPGSLNAVESPLMLLGTG